jgi:hypothetical protein
MGLILRIYRSDLGDCSNDGLSKHHTEVTAVNCEGPFDPTPERPAVIIDSHVKGCVRVVPAGNDGQPLKHPGAVGPMFGGTYVTTSDSRFGQKVNQLLGHDFYGAVPFHDRFERSR